MANIPTPVPAPEPESAPTPTPQPAQNITINMVTPQAGEATEGLSEIEKGGRFCLIEADPTNALKTVKKFVDAQGQPLS